VRERDLLLEIGVEELPTSMIDDIFGELEEKFSKAFHEARLSYQHLHVWGTPRRMVIYVEDLAETQAPLMSEIKGPPKKVGMADDGTLLAPALAFARAQGIEVNQLFVRETERGTYIFGRKEEPGKPTEEILPLLLPSIILALEFPRTMLWGEGEFRFVRPIRWIVALWGGREVRFSIAGVSSSSYSRGHRFFAPLPVVIPSASEYRSSLFSAKVVVDPKDRRRLIAQCLDREAQSLGGNWLRDEALLDEVNFLVECPEVVVGRFEPKYLVLPSQVLITVMKHHQKYFACVDAQGNLLPFFFVVLNRPKNDAEKIIHGNERVLRARLEDALFFFHEDRKKTLASRVELLRGVVFQEGLGTLWEKTNRLIELAEYLRKLLHLSEEECISLKRAALLAKADLVSEMVKEFPELQGYMGKTYALLEGEGEEVASAIEEMYFPLPGQENYPKTHLGRVLSLVDKMDTLVSSFALGRIPTGSLDPLGLRRTAQGIVDILINGGLHCPLLPWITYNLQLLEKQGFATYTSQVLENVKEFIFARLRSRLLGEGVHYSVINAVFATKNDDVYDAFRRIEFLDRLVRTRREFLLDVVTGFTRANNISRNFPHRGEVREELLQEEAERVLYQTMKEIQGTFCEKMRKREYEEALEMFSSLLPALNTFFDRVLVMCDEEALRENRLRLMKSIVEMWSEFADMSLLVLEDARGEVIGGLPGQR